MDLMVPGFSVRSYISDGLTVSYKWSLHLPFLRKKKKTLKSDLLNIII